MSGRNSVRGVAAAIWCAAATLALAGCGGDPATNQAPPQDAGCTGCVVDAGTPDDGGADAGTVDAGTPDAGTPDSGTADAGTPDDGGVDAGTPDDGGVDAGTPDDGGTADAGADAGTPDGGGTDGGSADGGVDGGTDGGVACTGHCYDNPGPITFGTPGPWPVANETFGAAQGIGETPIVGVTTDETENLWVATNRALYLLKPGDSTFTRFAGHDGLHTSDNPVDYCDNFGPSDSQTNTGSPLPRCTTGAADSPGIISIVGGGPNEVFVGYAATNQWNLLGYSPSSKDPLQHNIHDVNGTWMDPNRHDGKVDRVRLATDHTLIVDRFDFVSYNSAQFWHDKSPLRMIFDHFVHAHELYVGTEHGIDRVQPDNYAMPRMNAGHQYVIDNPTQPDDWWLDHTFPWLSDHLHPRVCFHQYCSGDENNGDDQRMGDWFALALDASGDLWVGGRWSAGKIFWAPKNVDKNPDGTWWIQNPPNSPKNAPTPQGWCQRGGNAYLDPATGRNFTYGDPWCGSSGVTTIFDPTYRDPITGRRFRPATCSPGSGIPPVFPVPEEGEVAAISAVTVAPDGRVWWANAPVNGGDPSYGLAVQAPPDAHFQYVSPSSFGMNDNVRDLVALPDGRLALGGDSTGLWLWTPGNASATHIAGGAGIPGNRVLRLELDTMVNPPALHVATNNGAAVLRVLPP